MPSPLGSVGVRSARTATIAACLAVLCTLPDTANAQLKALETQHLRLVYFDGTESYLVPHATRTFLNALRFQQRLFDFEPSDDVTVLLADFSDAGNAGASSVPRNTLTVQIAPLSFAFETIASNERMNVIMNHELVHLVTMDQATRQDRAFRQLFGGKVVPVSEQPESILYFYLGTPRVAAPRWFHEGAAVFIDTWMAGGLGRAQGGYDEMVFRSMVRDGATFYDPLGLASEGTKIDFQLQTNAYLYGTRFITWLARHYGPERVVEWMARHEGSRAYYASQFRNVFGLQLEQAWRRWTEDERTFQQRNLNAIRTYPLTDHRDITTRALGSVSRAHYDPGRGMIYAGFNYPGAVGHIGAISVETGAVERIVDIKGPVVFTVTSTAYDSEAPAIFYTTDNGARRDLMRVDPDTGRAEMLQRDARIGDLALNKADRSLWGIRHLNGLCTLVRIPPPYRDWQRVVTWPYGTVVYDLDVSPDGRLLSASFAEITGRQDVRILRTDALLKADTAPLARFDFDLSVPNGFVFSPDGRYLYGSSYYTGVSNIFRYEIATGSVEAVTNTDTGFFRPVPIDDRELIVFRYSGQGFVPARITPAPVHDIAPITFLGERLAEEHPVIREWIAGSPADIPYDTLPKRTRVYRLAGGLRRESIYPVVQGYKDSAAIGLRLNMSDALQLNRAYLTATFTPDTGLPVNERLHLQADYRRFDWHARAEWNGADFYDLFGPTKVGRKGYVASLGHTKLLVFDEPRRMELELNGRVAGNLDRLPEYQNVPVDVDSLLAFKARLGYSDVRNSLGYVDDETGRRWGVIAQAYHVDGRTVPRFHGTYDAGLALPVGHSSLWLRTAAGYSPRDSRQPFANFFFGGFGNNWIDRGDEKRYRDYQSFPGAGLNEIGGRNFLKSMLEWNLPPIRFRRAGTAGFHATWARPALFVTGLGTNLDEAARRRTAGHVGAQVDIRLSVLSTLDMTLSFGGALALERGHAPRREAMVSLKVLR